MSRNGWIGVDLDGTLAHYDGWKGETHIGEPVPAMAARVKAWLAEGREVRIFTARVTEPDQVAGDRARLSVPEIRRLIEDWAEKHFGVRLAVTNVKDFALVELWDDRAVRVVFNTGEPCCDTQRKNERMKAIAKPLAWEQDGNDWTSLGQCAWITFYPEGDGDLPPDCGIEPRGPYYSAGMGEGPNETFDTLDEAKAWCQAEMQAWVDDAAFVQCDPDMQRDAERWRAVVGCGRLRWLGSAGLHGDPDPNGKPWNGYAHIGMEFWTKHPDADDTAESVELFTRYADKAVEVARSKP